ncbi:MAG: hypothetical protein QOF16_421 [Actinomycetota bacterium]|nr:hypothetical protein [Actinomycetota bacterium]
MDVPREAVPVLVKALGAYLRAAQPRDLPTSVRRLREFRPRALEQHADAVLALLDDDAQRALIEQWLDKSKPALRRNENDALRLVVERGEGWAEKLQLVTAPVNRPGTTKKSAPSRPPEPERDRLRAEKAREDVRKAREERDSAQAHQKTAIRDLEDARAEIGRLQASVVDAQKRAAAAADALDKERRKAERDTTRARKQAEDARRELKEVRRALASTTSDLAKATEKPHRTVKRQEAPPDEAKTRPRKPLKAPKGRLDDDPQTLNGWLETPGVRLLVDGYNVALAKGGAVPDLADRRRRLVEGIATLMRMKKAQAVVIFDGSEVEPGTARRSRGPVRIEYSRPDVIADDHLIAKLEGLPASPVIVATNDRQLQQRSAALGATIATSDQLLALIR